MGTLIAKIRIIEDKHMVDPHRRQRTWLERIFSWPWRPWRSWKIVMEPSPTIYKLKDADIVDFPVLTYICHPEIAALIYKSIDESEATLK